MFVPVFNMTRKDKRFNGFFIKKTGFMRDLTNLPAEINAFVIKSYIADATFK